MRYLAIVAVALCCAGWLSTSYSAQPHDPQETLNQQREAMKKLAFMDGTWRGSAWTFLPTRERVDIVQTERVGTFLDGTIRVIEGRGYMQDGSIGFNAFAVISYEVNTGKYMMRSYAMGYQGDFEIKVRDDGFEWEVPRGRGTVKYVATVADGKWTEVGDYSDANVKAMRILEMNLVRLGDTEWPAGGAIPMK